MRISQKGLYALQALSMLARHPQGVSKIHEIATEEKLPEKFLEIILSELKHARIVESTRGAKGGYRLRRAPAEITLGEVVRLIDGPVAPFADADQLRTLIEQDAKHRAIYSILLEVRNAAASILDHRSVADISPAVASPAGKRGRKLETAADAVAR